MQRDTKFEQQALEVFLLDNPDLAQLEALLDEFNIFEAVGAVRQEVRHSDFLTFLLNPRERHGLGAAFAQQLLLTAVLDLGHGFHETAQGLRYLSSENGRREVLTRLLHLNHQRHAEEVALSEGKEQKAEGRKKRKPGKMMGRCRCCSAEAEAFVL